MHNKWNSANVDQVLLRKGEEHLLYRGPEGSVVRNDHLVMSDIADGPALAALLRRLGLENGGLFCVPQGASDEAARAFGLKKGVPCTQWVYGESQPPRVPAAEVRPITEEYLPLCAAHYHPEDDEAAYLRSRMEAGQLWGLFEDGQLAAFIGVHHEGSMGILEVLPEYRRRGLAMALEGWLIRWHLERGWTPFCHVYEDNPASHALQKKLGLTPAPEQVVWLHRPHGEDEE
jgi:tRNA (guanine37-N1)-methyltransferase